MVTAWGRGRGGPEAGQPADRGVCRGGRRGPARPHQSGPGSPRGSPCRAASRQTPRPCTRRPWTPSSPAQEGGRGGGRGCSGAGNAAAWLGAQESSPRASDPPWVRGIPGPARHAGMHPALMGPAWNAGGGGGGQHTTNKGGCLELGQLQGLGTPLAFNQCTAAPAPPAPRSGRAAGGSAARGPGAQRWGPPRSPRCREQSLPARRGVGGGRWGGVGRGGAMVGGRGRGLGGHICLVGTRDPAEADMLLLKMCSVGSLLFPGAACRAACMRSAACIAAHAAAAAAAAAHTGVQLIHKLRYALQGAVALPVLQGGSDHH